MPSWYDPTPTVWDHGDGTITYINCPPKVQATLPADWVALAQTKNEFITVITRKALAEKLAGVDATAITTAKLDLEVKTPEDEAKPLTVKEWEACVALAAEVAVDVKPAEEPVVKK